MAALAEPSPDGRFGEFGGRFLPESLVPACRELEAAFRAAWADPAFHDEYNALLRDYGGRPTPVTECHRLSERLGVRVLLKREDLAHTGSHKLNNVIGQSLLTRRMGKPRVIAETGAGQHGVAAATACAPFGLDCVVYMGEVGVEAAGGAAIGHGVPGVVHGMKSYLVQDEVGQVNEAHSISAGLDYPGVGPEHSHLSATGRATYVTAADAEVLDAFQLLSHTE